jgi:hypothetical protein
VIKVTKALVAVSIEKALSTQTGVLGTTIEVIDVHFCST